MAPPEISLPQFEGPLDLLLALVRKNEVEITDIPIAEITEQYLDYLHQAEALNLDLGAEFIYMAAVLIHIKSECLLGQDPELAGEPDPRQELVRQLLNREQARHGAEFLAQQLEIHQAACSRSAIGEFREPPELPEPGGTLNLLQVLRLAQQALAAARTYAAAAPASASVSVEEMARWLDERIAAAPGELDAAGLLSEQPDGLHRSALFLAMLEMARAARIRLEQPHCFGSISIHRIGAGAGCGTTVP